MSINNSYNLEDQIALISGAGTGIGKTIALKLAKAGANIVALARNAQRIENTVEEIRKLGVQAKAIPTDITQPGQVERAVEETISQFGKIDILCNNAGILIMKPVVSLSRIGSSTNDDAGMNSDDEELTVNDWHRVLETNLIGNFLLTQAVGAHMIRRHKGRVINISSIVADEGLPYYAAYAGSKAAVNVLTRCLASEWAQFNINVNAVAPGVTKTDMIQPFLEDPKVLQDILDPIPLGRLAEPEEIASTVLFLASEAASYITGQILSVDGGLLGHGPEKA